jgi:hypothetical protein
MEELMVKEIAELIGIPSETAKSRIKRAKIKPERYIGPTAVYAPEVVEVIRNSPGRGRPPMKK